MGSHILTPSTPPPAPIQTTISAPKIQVPIVDLEESDDEQGLQSDALDLLVNSITNPEQPTASILTPEVALVVADVIEQPIEDLTEQLRPEQTSTTEPLMAEPPIVEKIITSEPAIE